MYQEPRYLLLMSCSQRKRTEPGLLPAVERYDGPTFRVLRRFLKERPSQPLDIRILSAKYGLISDNQHISDYDQRMTRTRALELQANAITQLRQTLSSQTYQKLCICMGQGYLLALDGYNTILPPELSIKIAAGPPGKKLAELHAWLYEKSSTQRYLHSEKILPGKALLRGIEITMTQVQIFDIARRALEEGRNDSTNYHSWYVLVDGKQVSPKWLIHCLTGLPVSAFTTSEARRVLEQLGIELRHT